MPGGVRGGDLLASCGGTNVSFGMSCPFVAFYLFIIHQRAPTSPRVCVHAGNPLVWVP
jgi:hypothetical protein